MSNEHDVAVWLRFLFRSVWACFHATLLLFLLLLTTATRMLCRTLFPDRISIGFLAQVALAANPCCRTWVALKSRQLRNGYEVYYNHQVLVSPESVGCARDPLTVIECVMFIKLRPVREECTPYSPGVEGQFLILISIILKVCSSSSQSYQPY